MDATTTSTTDPRGTRAVPAGAIFPGLLLGLLLIL